MKLIRLLIVILLVATAAAQPRKRLSPDSYDVYSAILSQHYGSWFEDGRPIVIFSQTVLEPQGHAGGGCTAQAKNNPTIRKLVEKLLSEKQKFEIERNLRVPGPYKLVKSDAQIRRNEERGVLSLSTVEFSDDHSEAMVLVARDCGGLCGDGHVWILDRGSQGWKLAEDQLNCGWIR